MKSVGLPLPEPGWFKKSLEDEKSLYIWCVEPKDVMIRLKGENIRGELYRVIQLHHSDGAGDEFKPVKHVDPEKL